VGVSGGRRLTLLASTLACCVLLAACGSGSPSTLDPHGPGARTIARLWWFMFAVASAVVLFVGVLIVVGVLRRRRSDPASDEPRWSLGLLFGGGVAFPIVILTVLWVWSLHDMAALSQPAGDPALTIDVVGHQWWWEVRYPRQGIVTANDIHIPVGQPVSMRLTTNDVLHSFWVPQLTGKTDMITGRTNTMTIQADAPGIYRGQCAEFCGLQHAQMIFSVVAQAPADFEAWMSREAAPPASPTDPFAQQGSTVFQEAPCAACHTIRGTAAKGTLGPDLSDFGGRLSIGAGAAPNTRGNLAGWIVDAQHLKPGNLMPPMQLDPDDLQALIAYLESLR
jgi:cytochrome c oxidase subunit II